MKSVLEMGQSGEKCSEVLENHQRSNDKKTGLIKVVIGLYDCLQLIHCYSGYIWIQVVWLFTSEYMYMYIRV